VLVIQQLLHLPNVTSKSQPMDQGIIQATKLKFRKRQISQMDKGVSKTGSQILKDISILDAIFWITFLSFH
jgi:hypothetical protein